MSLKTAKINNVCTNWKIYHVQKKKMYLRIFIALKLKSPRKKHLSLKRISVSAAAKSFSRVDKKYQTDDEYLLAFCVIFPIYGKMRQP